MKQIKTYITISLSIFLTGTIYAQQRPKINIWNPPVQKNIRNLSVGDTVPNFNLANIYNNSNNSRTISDYRDRLIIFDFGNIYCKGCVEALPRMDSLQKKFGNKIKIFWVTPEYREDIEKFWNRKNNPYTKNNTISTIVEDSTVRAYFKHKNWPHEAWVYKGRVIAITTSQYVNSNNIKNVLNNQQVNWPVKDDFYVFDGTQEPLFQIDENQINIKNTQINYVAISGYKEKVNSTGLSGGSGIVRDQKHKTIRTFFLNQPIYNSYLLNWINLIKPGSLIKPNASGIGPNEVIWEVSNKSKYRLDQNSSYEAEWLRENGICFESLCQDTGQTNQQLYKATIDNMDRLLGLHARWEKRKEKVLILTKTTGHLNIKSKSRLTENEENYSNKGDIQQFRDTPLSSLVYELNQEAENPYVFDETGYKENVDLKLRLSSWKDLSAIRKAISRYGLVLKEEERIVDKFVFTETLIDKY